MPRAFLILAAALGCFSLVAFAQPATQLGPKKAVAGKATDDGKSKSKDAGKPKAAAKNGEGGKDPVKPIIPLEKMKFPKDSIIVIVDDLIKAGVLKPNMYLLKPEEYKSLLDQIEALKLQLKPDRKTPSSCKLQGKLQGDFFVFRAEFGFFTDPDQPKTSVLLGLKGAFLSDGGKLDGQAPDLEYSDKDGFVVRLDKGGHHQLTLNFQVPAPVKKTTGGTLERGFDLSLPGAAATRMDVELPTTVKEVMWNNNLEKTQTPGRWSLSLGTTLAINISWKEPVPLLSGIAKLPQATGKIQVDVDATQIKLNADLLLVDSGLQTTKWHLLLPPEVDSDKIKVVAPGDLAYTLFSPDKDKPYYTLETSGATAKPWQVSVLLHVPRPNLGARVEVGPFQVVGAFGQTGTITVKMPAKFSFGQRLVPARTASVNQVKNTETDLEFSYVLPPISENDVQVKGKVKAPLALEWQFEKNQLETKVTHDVKLQTGQQGWELDVTTRIHVKALFAAIHAVDLQLPPPRPRGLGLIGTSPPGIDFPGALPWGSIWTTYGLPWTYANATEYTITDEEGQLKVIPQGATGEVRVLLEHDNVKRENVKKATLVLNNKFRLPAQSQRIHLELPRPLNTHDRAAKLTIQSDDGIELMHGPAEAEEPVPDRNRFDLAWDKAPSAVDLAWRPYHRQVVTESILDVQVHEHTAQLTQALRFPKDPFAAPIPNGKNALITLKIPPGIGKVSLASGGEIINHDASRRTLRVRPAPEEKTNLVLQYDLAMTPDGELNVTPIWPEGASLQDVKARVWAAPGVKARLTDALLRRGLWKERSIEVVPGKDQFPALVLGAFGSNLPLALKIENSPTTALAAFVADRALIQVRMLDDGSQQCRAFYFVRAIHAPHVDLELPLTMPRLREMPVCKLGGTLLPYDKIDPTGKVIRVSLHPDLMKLPAVLEVSYAIPGDGMEQNSPWRTTLYAPIFRSEVWTGEMRWQLMTATPMLTASMSRHAVPHLQWSLETWMLTPEPAFNSADLESWLTGKEATQPASAVTYSFSLISAQPETVFHFPWQRNWWLLGCSGLFLIVTLGVYLSPLPRIAFWFLLLAMVLGVLAFVVFCPAGLPLLLFGLQPGVVLFVVFAVGQWVSQEYARRHEAYHSVFVRTKPGSTLMRSAAKRPREASTVDAPTDAPVSSAPSTQEPHPGPSSP